MEGTTLFFGSIYVASTAEDLEQDVTVLDLRGTPDIFFSTEGMELAQFALPRVEVLAVAEIGAVIDSGVE